MISIEWIGESDEAWFGISDDDYSVEFRCNPDKLFGRLIEFYIFDSCWTEEAIDIAVAISRLREDIVKSYNYYRKVNNKERMEAVNKFFQLAFGQSLKVVTFAQDLKKCIHIKK